MNLVFDNPIHASGCLIFDDPSEFLDILDPRVGGGSDRRVRLPGLQDNRYRALREEEEILAIIQGYLSTEKH